MGSKQIVSEICLQGLTLPRLLKIPEPANAPETDILNIQFSVLDLLAIDSEIHPLTNNLWNLGFDISAFNTQKQAWDVLGVDTQVYLPEGARVKITLKTDETIAVPPPRTRDPRKSVGKAQMASIAIPTPPQATSVPTPPSKRDPRRKPGNTSEQEGPRVARRDPRVKRKESEEAAMTSTEEATELPTGNLLQSMKALPLPVDPDAADIRGVSVEVETESDSDEGNLQIDESFDAGAKTVNKKAFQENRAPSIIRESQLARIQTTEAPDDSAGLWDEIYGIGERKVGDEKEKKGREKEMKMGVKREPDEEEVTIVAEMNQLDLRVPSVEKAEEQPALKIPTSVEKTPEQLETEKQLLLKLVEERERLKATLAEAGLPDIPMEAKEVEEGELSDSSESDEEESTKLKPNLFSPESPDPEPQPDFFSPESPKVIEVDDEEEVHVIPLEREDEEEDRFKKYWDDFPEEDPMPEKSKPKTKSSSITGDLRAKVEKKIMDKVDSEKKLEVTIPTEMVQDKNSARVVIEEAPGLSFWKSSTGNKEEQRQVPPSETAYVPPIPPPPPPIRKFLLDSPPAPYPSQADGSKSPFPLIPPKAPYLVKYHDLNDKIPVQNARTGAKRAEAVESSRDGKAQGRGNNVDTKSESRVNRDKSDGHWTDLRREGRRRRRSRSSSRSRSRSRERTHHSRQDKVRHRGSPWKRKDRDSVESSRKNNSREKKETRWDRETSERGTLSSTEATVNTSSTEDKSRSEKALKSEAVSEKERHDKAMLCFYEGEDCLDDPGEAPLFPEPVPAVSKAPVAASPSATLSSSAPYPYFKPGGMDLTRVHPITAVHEVCRRMGCGAPLWHERMVSSVGSGTWAFDVTVAGVRYSMPGSAREKKDAQRDGARNCLTQLGIISCYGKS